MLSNSFFVGLYAIQLGLVNAYTDIGTKASIISRLSRKKIEKFNENQK